MIKLNVFYVPSKLSKVAFPVISIVFDICLASHQAGLESEVWGGEGYIRSGTRALLDHVDHRTTKCNVNYASFGQVSRPVCKVTLLVLDSLDCH